MGDSVKLAFLGIGACAILTASQGALNCPSRLELTENLPLASLRSIEPTDNGGEPIWRMYADFHEGIDRLWDGRQGLFDVEGGGWNEELRRIEFLPQNAFSPAERTLQDRLWYSSTVEGSFFEAGALRVFTKSKGMAVELTSIGKYARIPKEAVYQALLDTLSTNGWTMDDIDTIQFFHTHPENPVLSAADYESAVSFIQWITERRSPSAPKDFGVHVYSFQKIDSRFVVCHWGNRERKFVPVRPY